MKTQITQLEMSVLNAIKHFTAELFSSDSGNWAYVNEIEDVIDAKQLRALISTLQQKRVLSLEGNFDGAYVVIREGFYRETGNSTPAGSPEIELINLELK